VRALVDTGALVALAWPGDQYHADATRITRGHRAAGGRLVSTVLVLAEFYTHVLCAKDPGIARGLLSRLLADPAYEWLDVPLSLVVGARSWLDRFRDQGFSLVDAVSFEVMRRHNITHAFSFDRHFAVAGFQLLR
jgi:predicted nucleic acid-binding protein